jgi:hypothetical protein
VKKAERPAERGSDERADPAEHQLSALMRKASIARIGSCDRSDRRTSGSSDGNTGKAMFQTHLTDQIAAKNESRRRRKHSHRHPGNIAHQLCFRCLTKNALDAVSGGDGDRRSRGQLFDSRPISTSRRRRRHGLRPHACTQQQWQKKVKNRSFSHTARS